MSRRPGRRAVPRGRTPCSSARTTSTRPKPVRPRCGSRPRTRRTPSSRITTPLRCASTRSNQRRRRAARRRVVRRAQVRSPDLPSSSAHGSKPRLARQASRARAGCSAARSRAGIGNVGAMHRERLSARRANERTAESSIVVGATARDDLVRLYACVRRRERLLERLAVAARVARDPLRPRRFAAPRAPRAARRSGSVLSDRSIATGDPASGRFQAVPPRNGGGGSVVMRVLSIRRRAPRPRDRAILPRERGAINPSRRAALPA